MSKIDDSIKDTRKKEIDELYEKNIQKIKDKKNPKKKNVKPNRK